MMLISTAFAQDTATAAPAAAPTLVAAVFQYAPIILIFLVFYFLIIRPQNQAAKDQQKTQESLKKGDVVLTESGLVGEVVKVSESFVSLRINAEDTLTVLKPSIRRTLEGEAAKGWEPASLTKAKK